MGPDLKKGAMNAAKLSIRPPGEGLQSTLHCEMAFRMKQLPRKNPRQGQPAKASLAFESEGAERKGGPEGRRYQPEGEEAAPAGNREVQAAQKKREHDRRAGAVGKPLERFWLNQTVRIPSGK
jgi:hypothetical protein